MTVIATGLAALCQSRNILLKNLSREEVSILAAGVERIEAEPEAVIFEIGQTIDALYFPDATIARLCEALGDETVECGVIGSEGFAGWEPLLGCDRSMHRVIMDARGGAVVRISADAVARCHRISDGFHARLLRYVQVLTVQMARRVASTTRDPLEKRLACWLLMRHDRIAGDELRIQHAEIAAGIGARRASVTDCLHRLEGERMIRCRRGKLLIRDRAALQGLAGDSYGRAEALYGEWIAPFGKSGATANEATRVRGIVPLPLNRALPFAA